MPSALVVLGGGMESPPLVQDLASAGIRVILPSTSTNLAQSTLSSAPDLLIIYQDAVDTMLFEEVERVGGLFPLPIVLFTRDPDADKIARAMVAGIHAYVIDGYGPNRLRSVIHLAQARFRRDRLIRDELAQANQRFEERKLVDRAKGILMGARQLREEEAYRALRRVAMHTKQRIGQVSQMVIDSARYAEAVNRAGQLRMLSQRVVKLYALSCASVRPAETKGLLADSIALIDDTLAILARNLSKPTFGDLLDGVGTAWRALRQLLDQPAALTRLEDIDRLAESVLARSEQLTANLEVSGYATGLHVINVAGRQRMLSQRLAKAVLMSGLLDGPAKTAPLRTAKRTKAELVDGIHYLLALPLSNDEIRRELAGAARLWDDYQGALDQCGTMAGLERTADLSERLLEHFDHLTTLFERAMQAFVSASADAETPVPVR